MSSDAIPSKSEVMGWNAPRLAEYMRKLDLAGCDKVIMKHSMNGPRFLNMSDNDLQKFPKLHAPYITKICMEINKKEDKRGFFHRKSAPQKNWEPEPVQDPGWDSEEFDQSDDDYESPDADNDDADEGDYESPTEGDADVGPESENDNDYEPPPSGPEESAKPICPAKPMSDSDYIDNTHNRVVSVKTTHNMPPTPPERPGPGLPPPPAARPGPGPRRDQSPPRPFRAPNRPPTVDRTKKPGTVERGLPNLPTRPDRDDHLPGRKPGGIADSSVLPRRPPVGDKSHDLPRLPKPPLPGMVNRSSSSLGKVPSSTRPGLQDHRNDLQDEAHMPRPGGGVVSNSNTFPLPSRGQSPRPGPPGNTYTSESLPPSVMGGGSLPSRLSEALGGHRVMPRGQTDRYSLPPPQPKLLPPMLPDPDPDDDQDLDPLWYVGQVTRGQAEAFLRQINQDGTYLVRDSSKRSSTQPYTLMVLYQDKVYNIQIRYHSDQDIFQLGTNMKNRETFTMVKDIISFHTQVPLLLIEAKDRGSGPQKQCLLIHPVQYR